MRYTVTLARGVYPCIAAEFDAPSTDEAERIARLLADAVDCRLWSIDQSATLIPRNLQSPRTAP